MTTKPKSLLEEVPSEGFYEVEEKDFYDEAMANAREAGIDPNLLGDDPNDPASYM